jgi:dihydrofolate reductase
MRKLVAWVFMYSLDGLLADEGTEDWQFCFGPPVDSADQKQKLGVYKTAYAHIMGRTAYEGMAGALPTADHPYAGIMNAARAGRLLPDAEDGPVGQHHHAPDLRSGRARSLGVHESGPECR